MTPEDGGPIQGRNIDASGSRQMKSTASGDGFWEIVRTLVYALVVALTVRTTAYQPFNIPSDSMVPTLLTGDFLFVSKFSYGYSRYSLPFGIPLFTGRIFATEPERGDVVVFQLPRDPSQTYIKRLIGLPGDVIRVSRGILHINGVPAEREFIGVRSAETDLSSSRMADRYLETLPNGTVHDILELSDTAGADNTQDFIVPEGHYFMMGDNRDNSTDSRYRLVGPVPAENLVGRAEFIWFSLEDARAWEIWKWPWAIRFSRMFTGID